MTGPCASGSYSAASASSCTSCPKASYSAVAASSCASFCPAGYYQVTGSTACVACSAGTYQSSSGASSCYGCSSGYFSSTSASSCTGNVHEWDFRGCSTGVALSDTFWSTMALSATPYNYPNCSSVGISFNGGSNQYSQITSWAWGGAYKCRSVRILYFIFPNEQ